MTRSSPHDPQGRSVENTMRMVLLALAPGVVLYVVFFGCGILVQSLIAASVAVLAERVALRLRGQPVGHVFGDSSIFVLALLFALAMPPYAVWWATCTGVLVAVLIGKHAYGGLGNNVFNPAMVGYVFVLLCFPYELSRWPANLNADFIGPIESFRLIFLNTSDVVDGVSGATVLDFMRTQTALMRMQSEIVTESIFGHWGGRSWEWINLGFLAGGLWLCFRRVVAWRIPLGVLIGLGSVALWFVIIEGERHAGPLFHYAAGATMLGAFFIASDPVSSATTPRGMLLFGIGVGVLIYFVRSWGSYPDGIAFAVLSMNALAPLIDHFTQPKLYGAANG